MQKSLTTAKPTSMSSALLSRLARNRWLYFMVLPGLVYFVLFKYWPMYGIFIAFKDFQPFLSFWNSPFVGFKHFDRLFSDSNFIILFRNTLILATYNILFFFPLPIVIALMLNELRHEFSKRIVQTLVYIPHFMSWVVVVGIAYMFLTTEGGIVNELLLRFGGEKINFLVSNEWFRTLITAEVMWKETGWGTIIFLAALSGVDPQLYEAARMDGANRLRQLWHITLPAIRSTIIILLILRLGHFFDTGFEQIFLMLNAMNREVATANGAQAVQWTDNGSNDQQWTLLASGSYYKIVNRNSGKVLTVDQASTTDGGTIVQSSDTGSTSQLWQLVANK